MRYPSFVLDKLMWGSLLAMSSLIAACEVSQTFTPCTTSAQCTGGQVCSGGRCDRPDGAVDSGGTDTGTPDTVTCPTGMTLCGATCVDTRTSDVHCGRCDNPCTSGSACMAGNCTPLCTAPQTFCGGGCVDTNTDPAHCGMCGHQCSPGEFCNGGTCSLSPFGSETDGTLTITDGSTTQVNTLESGFTGTAGNPTITVVAPTGFAVGQLLFLHQSQGTGAGNWEVRRVTTVNGTMLTLDRPLEHAYANGSADVAQAIVMPQYTRVQIDSGTLTAPAWNGTSGGILAIAVAREIVVGATGTITMDAKGYRGFPDETRTGGGHQGESGDAAGAYQPAANGSGGGGAGYVAGCSISGAGSYWTAGAGGGGYGTAGTAGRGSNMCGAPAGSAGSTAGANDQTTIFFGGGGGSNVGGDATHPMIGGGRGGGILYLASPRISIVGHVTTGGQDGRPGFQQSISTPLGTFNICQSSSGAGAGGAMYLHTDDVTLSVDVLARGGSGAVGCGAGGNGGDGRITIDGVTRTPAVVGTTNPPFTAVR